MPTSSLVARPSRYGQIRDLPDIRDHLVGLSTRKLPPSVDLRTDKRMPRVWDQGQLGSCTSFGIAAALEFHEATETEPSHLFIYYNERVIEGTVGSDSGAQIRDGLKSVAKAGACPESLWPYDISKFKQKPPASAYKAAKSTVALSYARVGLNARLIQGVLAAGNLVVIGISVYSSFESDAVANSGIVPMPDPESEHLLGGHCMALAGYEELNGKLYFHDRNSWGASWADHGYCVIPADYLTNPQLGSDYWTISKVGASA